jgi:membrane protease YdiL (CAAX protease family)
MADPLPAAVSAETDQTPAGSRTVVGLSIAAIAAAEVVGNLWGETASTVCHGFILLVLLTWYSWHAQPETSSSPALRALPILALLPLLRVLSLTMPLKPVAEIYWYALVGAPLLLAAFLVARLLHLSRPDIGLRLDGSLLQIGIGLLGIPLGLAAFLLTRPAPLLRSFAWYDVVISAAILLLFSGFAEELIFRGMLQSAIEGVFPGRGIVGSSALFAAMYLGTLSPVYVGFALLLGLGFGWAVRRTHTIWGVALAHGALTIGLLCLWPRLLA